MRHYSLSEEHLIILRGNEMNAPANAYEMAMRYWENIGKRSIEEVERMLSKYVYSDAGKKFWNEVLKCLNTISRNGIQ